MDWDFLGSPGINRDHLGSNDVFGSLGINLGSLGITWDQWDFFGSTEIILDQFF